MGEIYYWIGIVVFWFIIGIAAGYVLVCVGRFAFKLIELVYKKSWVKFYVEMRKQEKAIYGGKKKGDAIISGYDMFHLDRQASSIAKKYPKWYLKRAKRLCEWILNTYPGKKAEYEEEKRRHEQQA